MRACLPVLFLCCLVACTAPDSPVGDHDSGPGDVCSNDGDCRSFDCGSDGHCVDVCAGVAHGTVCESYHEAECCGADSVCCSVGFEHSRCFPSAEGCPLVCPNTAGTTCGRDQICLYHTDPYGQAGTCQWHDDVGCVDACPAEQQCDYHGTTLCCDTGTTCVDGCCVNLPDGGLPAPDGGSPDAGTPDAG